MKRLLSAPDGNSPAARRDRALLEVMYACGLRASEAIGLEVGDVDLLEGGRELTADRLYFGELGQSSPDVTRRWPSGAP